VELSKRRIRLIDSVVPDEIIASIKEINREALRHWIFLKRLSEVGRAWWSVFFGQADDVIKWWGGETGL
jgi:hypothetical protein